MSDVSYRLSYGRSVGRMLNVAPLVTRNVSLASSTDASDGQASDLEKTALPVGIENNALAHIESESGALSVPRDSTETGTRTVAGWSRCASLLHDRDEAKFKAWKEDVDALLTFAALFSGVVTAFIIQTYQLLQPDSASITALILAQVSAQLSSFRTSSGFLNSTYSPISVPSTFQPPQSAVRVNALLYASLICSLSAAFMVILVKQWLNQYTDQLSDPSREAARLRQFRHDGLLKWKVPGIISLLPFILQVALALFFGALVQLLWHLQDTVALVATVFVAAILLFCVITLILPSVFVDCPYRSAQAQEIFVVVNPAITVLSVCCSYLKQRIRSALQQLGLVPPSKDRRVSTEVSLGIGDSWETRERKVVKAQEGRLDLGVVKAAGAMLVSSATDFDVFVQVLEPCLSQLRGPGVFQALYEILTMQESAVHSHKHTLTDILPAVHQFLDLLIKFNKKGDIKLQVMANRLFWDDWGFKRAPTPTQTHTLEAETLGRFRRLLWAFRSGFYDPDVRVRQLSNISKCLLDMTNARAFGIDGVRAIASCIPALILERDVEGTFEAYHLLLTVSGRLLKEQLWIIQNDVREALSRLNRIFNKGESSGWASKKIMVRRGFILAIIDDIIDLWQRTPGLDLVPYAVRKDLEAAGADVIRDLDGPVFSFERSMVEDRIRFLRSVVEVPGSR
ncbi:hypothetical protein AcV7_010283 [Taiwanofungus camphoratus]|nr:hypothetical protein AcV7_010283 [Antrodia cinnamomea]